MHSARRLAQSALFCALSVIATAFVRVPLPVGGYAHLGDAVVLLSGLLLGFHGAFAAALGAGIADLLAGYPVYLPATVALKWIVGVLACRFTQSIGDSVRMRILLLWIAAIPVWAGYYAYESILFHSLLVPLANLPWNILQCTVGVVIAAILYSRLQSWGKP